MLFGFGISMVGYYTVEILKEKEVEFVFFILILLFWVPISFVDCFYTRSFVTRIKKPTSLANWRSEFGRHIHACISKVFSFGREVKTRDFL